MVHKAFRFLLLKSFFYNMSLVEIVLRSILLLVFIMSLVLYCEADETVYFNRNAKWAHLPPSGGSLVSGRGNFRPGFYSRAADPRLYMSEPIFAFKVSVLRFCLNSSKMKIYLNQ